MLMTVFPPKSAFEALYKDTIVMFSKQIAVPLDKQLEFVHAIGSCFTEYYQQLARDSVSAADIHYMNLRRQSAQWHSIHSTETCFSCLRRRPQHGLPCKYIFCETCIRLFGDSCEDEPRDFLIKCCFLC